MMVFEISEADAKKVALWADEQDKEVLKRQKKSEDPFIKALTEDGIPYYGAIGGEISYTFTPTSLGIITVVKHSGTGEELNLTDFDSW